ncbi:MAG: nitrite reductase small subunit NirD [Candidatus Aenigmarchaeota archaeon]|nr:nitrite reductase small subunit NirD [Candidatus Aenigmarchaeota archaeon]
MEVRVGTTDEICEGSSKVVKVGDKEVAVFNSKGEFYGIGNTCPHRGGPLGEGYLTDDVVSCPLHDWKFDIRTGKCQMSSLICVPTYKVEVRGDEVFVIL